MRTILKVKPCDCIVFPFESLIILSITTILSVKSDSDVMFVYKVINDL